MSSTQRTAANVSLIGLKWGEALRVRRLMEMGARGGRLMAMLHQAA